MARIPIPDWVDRQFDVPFRMAGVGIAGLMALLATLSGFVLPYAWVFWGAVMILLLLPLSGPIGHRKIKQYHPLFGPLNGPYLDECSLDLMYFSSTILYRIAFFGVFIVLLAGLGAHALGLGNVVALRFLETGIDPLEKLGQFYATRTDWPSSLYQISFIVSIFCVYFAGFLIAQYKFFACSVVSWKEIRGLLLYVAIFSLLLFIELATLWTEVLSPNPEFFSNESIGVAADDDYIKFSVIYSFVNACLSAYFSILILITFLFIPNSMLGHGRRRRHAGLWR